VSGYSAQKHNINNKSKKVMRYYFRDYDLFIYNKRMLNTIHQIGAILGPHSDNESNTIEFFRT